VEKIVTIMLNVQLILAISFPEIAKTFQTTTDVLITMHVLLIDVLLKDVLTLKKIVLMEMHVPKMFVMQQLDNVFTPQLIVLPIIAKLENAILKLDANSLQEIVMMELHVLLIDVMIIVVVFILLIINCVMIMIQILLIDVISKKDVFTPQSFVMITILAPMMFVSMENANLSMHAKIATDALYLHAILLMDANLPQEIVMTTMLAL